MASQVRPPDHLPRFKASKTEQAVTKARESSETPRKDREGNDDKHRTAIKKCPCCIPGCNRVGVDIHHLKCVPGTRGMGMRAPDEYGLPLCRFPHHEDVEKHTSPAAELKWFAAHGILDPIGLAQSLWENARGDAPGMTRIILANKVSKKS